MKHYILYSKNINRDSFLWNMIGSLAMAFQSVILLMILSRIVGLVESGIFTIAYANANLFLTVGKYGVRYYQVSDVRYEFSFKEYCRSRWLTCITMMIISVGYVIYSSIVNSYTSNKSMIILWMCIFKLPDAFEDVYYGEYQRSGRLDVASKAMAIRMLSTMGVYVLVLIILRNQLLALIIATLYTYLVMVIFLNWTITIFPKAKESFCTGKNVVSLLKYCFPLFASSFLSFYIGNAPKYAIDSLLTDDLQACYGFIFMPVFVIGLLNGFIFNPMIYHIAELWSKSRLKDFLKQILLQMIYIVIITVVCMAGASLLGIPVLSFLYNTNLEAYKSELLILLLGGGFLGLSGLLNTVITIMRKQKKLLLGYLIIAILAYILSHPVVRKYEMWGAATFYTLLMAGLCIFFLAIFGTELIRVYNTLKREKEGDG